jgi:hypothetical protein
MTYIIPKESLGAKLTLINLPIAANPNVVVRRLEGLAYVKHVVS